MNRKMVRARNGLPLQSPRNLVLFLLLSTIVAWAEPGKAPAPEAPSPAVPEALIAIADVHGNYDDFVAILRHTGLIDQQNHWSGGKTTFVQTGDILDRGPKPREAMNLLMALEKEAPQAGGRVVPLLGNHEMMNMMGDLRYVTPLNYASYADGNSEQRQKAAYDEFAKWKAGHAALIAELRQPMELTVTEWMARHPLGYVEQREAFSPKGKYGEWLRGHDVVAQIGGVIYLHGGIQPDVSKMKIDAINGRVRDEIKNFDAMETYLQKEKVILPFFDLQEMVNVLQAEVIAELKAHVPSTDEKQAKIRDFLKLQEWLSVRVDGPLWFRGYDTWSDEEGAPQVSKVLAAYGVKHIVVGHTVQKEGRIRPRFGNEVFLIDTGMLSSYYPGGRASALESCGDSKFIAVYLDSQAVLVDAGASPATAAPDAAVVPADRLCAAAAAAAQ
jgi:hypothetical protein